MYFCKLIGYGLTQVNFIFYLTHFFVMIFEVDPLEGAQVHHGSHAPLARPWARPEGASSINTLWPTEKGSSLNPLRVIIL